MTAGRRGGDGGAGGGGGGGGGGGARARRLATSRSGILVVGGGTRVPLGSLLATMLLDATCAVVLGASNVQFDFHPLHWGSVTAFEDRSVDMVVLIVVRIVLCLVLLIPVSWLHAKQRRELEEALEGNRQSPATSPTANPDAPQLPANGESDEGVGTVHRPSAALKFSSLSPGGNTRELRGSSLQNPQQYLAIPTEALGLDDEGRDQFYNSRLRALLRATQSTQRTAALLTLFVLFSLCNVYVAIKCLYFAFTTTPWQQLAMGTTLIWTNVELICLKYYLERTTGANDVDAHVKALHPHALQFNPQIVLTLCDVCNLRIRKEGFVCPTCSFDCCLDCFKKKTAAHGQNQPRRGDKSAGVEDAESVSPLAFVLRGLRLMLPFWHVVAVAVICLIAAQAARVALPNFQGGVIDSVVTLNSDGFWHGIKWYGSVSAALLVLGSVRTFCTMLVMRNAVFTVRQQLFEALIVRDIAFFDGSTVGALTSRMTNDVNAMISPLRTLFNTVVANVILLIGGLVMCLTVSWRLSMISFAVIAPIVFVTGAYAKWSRKVSLSIWDSLAQANSYATEAFSNVRTVRAFSTERYEIHRFCAAMSVALQQTLRDAFAMTGATFCTSLLDLAQSATILAFGGNMVINHPDQLSVGQLITFQLYVNMMNGAYQSLNGVLNEFTRSAGAAERVLAMLDAKPDIDPREGQILVPRLVGNLALCDVSFRYQMRPDQLILNHVSMQFPQRKVTAIVGRSGSGKSTVLHLLLRFYDPTSGTVTIDDVDMKSVRLEWLHRHMAVVAQDTQLFNATIEENIRYGSNELDDAGAVNGHESQDDGGFVRVHTSKPVTIDDVRQAAIRAHAHDFIESFPDGYQTTVGERGVRLSGGQRQRIAIARAFLRQPQVLVLDEATSALDAESEAQVQVALDALIGDLRRADAPQSCAIIVVAHRLSTVMHADNIIVMQDGEVAEQGTHSDLLEKRGVYYQLVSKQLQDGRLDAPIMEQTDGASSPVQPQAGEVGAREVATAVKAEDDGPTPNRGGRGGRGRRARAREGGLY